MECMKQRSKIGKALAQIAVIVFFLNATHGACCFASPAADAMDGAAVEMPCHTDGVSSASSNSDDCCLMCMPVMVSIDVKMSHVSAMDTPIVKVAPVLTISGVDPPFRPPISLLS